MGKLIDQIHEYARVIMIIEESDEPDKGSLKVLKWRLNKLKKQLKEAVVA